MKMVTPVARPTVKRDGFQYMDPLLVEDGEAVGLVAVKILDAVSVASTLAIELLLAAAKLSAENAELNSAVPKALLQYPS
jgi:hypothetical protein